MGEIAVCHVCGSTALTVVLDMGRQPLAERMGDGPDYPLVLLRCSNCSLVQLSYITDPAEVFPADHPYSTGNTGVLRHHFSFLASRLTARLRPGDLLIDIGANDGTLLGAFKGDLFRKIAVEPTDQIRKVPEGITRYRSYFTPELADRIYREHGTARLIFATNVLAHVPDVHSFMVGVRSLLADEGEFVTENHELSSVTEGLQLDTIYHEHLRYYSLGSLAHLLAMHGFSVTDYEQIPTHGGSFRVTARRDSITRFAWRAEAVASELSNLCAGLQAGGARIWGIGAATRAVPLLHFANLVPYIEKVCEVAGSDKIGTCMPGTKIPVVDEAELVDSQPEYALVFAYHLAEAIIPSLRRMGYAGKFIIPLPEPAISDA